MVKLLPRRTDTKVTAGILFMVTHSRVKNFLLNIRLNPIIVFHRPEGKKGTHNARILHRIKL